MVVVCGLPNAGKTTYSKSFANVLHYDDIRRKTQGERIRIYQSKKYDCIEGIYNTAEMRKRLLDALSVYEDKMVCVLLDTPIDECIIREKSYRKRPECIIKYNKLEPPTLDEGWDEIIIIRGDEVECISRKAEA